MHLSLNETSSIDAKLVRNQLHLFEGNVNLMLYSILFVFSVVQIGIAVHIFLFMFAHRSNGKGKRIDYLLLANIYMTLVVISCFFIDMSSQYIYGYFHPDHSFDGWWCQIKGYMLYIAGYTFFHSFSVQAIYRICRIIYPSKTKRQPFRSYVLVSCAIWILAALELLPTLLLGDIEYSFDDFHCQLIPFNIRGSIVVCTVGFLFPFTIMFSCYTYTIYYVRKHNATLQMIRRRRRIRIDLLVLRRIISVLTVLTCTAVPHALSPAIFIIIAERPGWLMALEWLLTVLALISISILIPFVSPHLKNSYTRRYRRRIF